MKITLEKESFFQALQTVQRAISVRNPLPVLTGIKFTAAGDGQVFLAATDLEIGIKYGFGAEVLEPGSAVIPSKYIIELVRRLPAEPVYISSDQETTNIAVRYARSEVVINGYPVEEYPEMPGGDGGNELDLELNVGVIRDIVRQVAYAAGTDESRPVFSGVLFEAENENIQVVATDTYRMAWRTISWTGGHEGLRVIVPARALNELVRCTGGYKGQINIAATENQVSFSAGNLYLTSRLIGGQYPNYRQVVPREWVSRIRLNSVLLLEAVERASLMTRVNAPVIKFFVNDDVAVISSSSEAGHAHEEMAVGHEGDPVSMAFNARYLSDILKAAGDMDVFMEFTGPLSPMVIKTVDDDSYRALLLPVRLREE